MTLTKAELESENERLQAENEELRLRVANLEFSLAEAGAPSVAALMARIDELEAQQASASTAKPREDRPEQQYIVLHPSVGAWSQGAILTAKKLESRGINIERLIRQGAIAPHHED